MQAFITALTNAESGITANTLWADVQALVPFIVMIFGFAFGYRLLRKSLHAGAKGKVNI